MVFLEGSVPALPRNFRLNNFWRCSRQSPVANRCHFRLGRNFALPFFPSLVPRPSSRWKSALSFLRHQLRTKVCLACKRASAL